MRPIELLEEPVPVCVRRGKIFWDLGDKMFAMELADYAKQRSMEDAVIAEARAKDALAKLGSVVPIGKARGRGKH